MALLIYLDNCCYNRPYDDQEYLSIQLEAQSKLYIQNKIRDGIYELATSEVLTFEIDNMPFQVRKNAIKSFIEENASVHIGPSLKPVVIERAHIIMKAGIKYKDACHIASAILAHCQYFITTDKRVLKYKTEDIIMINPIDFVREMEDSL
ncbi:MAG: hypothetical protein IJU23_15220 [Proteobacteria bacterium]|nr:hypothetical protein [Pseudomonadota bacterium]